MTRWWAVVFGLIVATMVAALIMLFIDVVKDRGQCFASHDEQVTTFIMSGKVLIPWVHDQTFCDRWEFPNGRPKQEK